MSTSAQTVDHPLAYRPGAAGRVLGVSRSRIYELIAAGEITARKLGASTLVPRSELERYLNTLPTAASSAGDAS